jgi:hypothetical protein
MKKFSTQVLGFALAIFAGTAIASQPLELAKDAPDKYVVVKGDTLWGISGKFLQQPWRWPEIWQLNREQIANPHLIYPGDIVYLDSSGGTPRLRLGKAVGTGGNGATLARSDQASERAQPRVRVEQLAPEPVPTIDAHKIEPFLSRPLIVDELAMQAHPRIVATQDGRVFLGRGELAFVRGDVGEPGSDWHIYRRAHPLLDPDTRLPIAWEAEFVGTARLERQGDPSTMRITGTTEEVGPGDRLLPADRAMPINFAPRPPEAAVNGRIVSVYRGVAQAGRNNVIALNVGKSNGLEVGNVLAIKERSRDVPDRETGQLIRLPGQPIGHLLVFRVFDRIAYGLIMGSSRDVSIGDHVTNPE